MRERQGNRFCKILCIRYILCIRMNSSNILFYSSLYFVYFFLPPAGQGGRQYFISYATPGTEMHEFGEGSEKDQGNCWKNSLYLHFLLRSPSGGNLAFLHFSKCERRKLHPHPDISINILVGELVCTSRSVNHRLKAPNHL